MSFDHPQPNNRITLPETAQLAVAIAHGSKLIDLGKRVPHLITSLEFNQAGLSTEY